MLQKAKNQDDLWHFEQDNESEMQDSDFLFFKPVKKFFLKHLEVARSGSSTQKSTQYAENTQIEQKRAEAMIRMIFVRGDEGEMDDASSSGHSSHTFRLDY